MLVYRMPWFLFDCFVNNWFTPPPPSKKIARTPMIKEFKVPPREKTFLVAENCITYICTPDHFQVLRFQEWMSPAYEHYKSLGRSSEAYQAVKGNYLKYARE